ncbi:MAG: hypothetical protein ACHQ15_03820, partial [Candidatus Limnocylindrales bacterium]
MGALSDPEPMEGPGLERGRRSGSRSGPARGGVAHAPHRRLEPAQGLRRRVSRTQERFVVLAYRSAAWLFGHVPLGISWPAVRGVMLAGYALWPAKRRIIVANAAHVLGRPAG